ncbi:MAG TPA: carbohydrate kinase [Solirubrobacteraceae bacterium]|nr:carbohydrate kinase [Solirubrobacteraceae bacterium]
MGGAGIIVVAGEALIDLVPAGDGMLAAHPGGGPFNTARTLGRLERPVAYLGRISTDAFGAQLAGRLADDGVRLDAHVRTDDPTTLALVDLDERGSAHYRFYDAGTAAPGLTEAAALAALPDGVAALHVGTLGLVLEPMAAALEALAAELAGRALVMVDPNCRPAVVTDPAAYRARLVRVLAHADVVKVSDDDLAWLAPGVPATDAARALLGQGPAVVLLTRGADGALALTGEAEEAVAAPPVDVVDTIGAGDAFSGGWLAWWSERGLGRAELADAAVVAEATRFACLVAARTCERAGASPPWRAELA